MTRFLAKVHGLLSSPVGGVPRALLVVAAVLVVSSNLAPLWNLTMFAPQYGEGLRLDIYSHKLQGGNNGQDLNEINLLNHYIGMHDLRDEAFTEFLWMPFALGALALFFLRSAVMGRLSDLVDSLVLFGWFGIFSLWSFAYKLYRYGHDLAPGAPVKVDPFMPPVFGGKQLANFEVFSYPQLGTYAIAAVAAALLAALLLGWREARRTADAPARVRAGPSAVAAGP